MSPIGGHGVVSWFKCDCPKLASTCLGQGSIGTEFHKDSLKGFIHAMAPVSRFKDTITAFECWG